MQMGFESIILKKLHSFLVAAEAACSKGDFPVVAEEAKLTVVAGLATAIAPTLLAAAVPELLNATSGAAQPLIKVDRTTMATWEFAIKEILFILLTTASNVIDTSRPRTILNGFKGTVWSFLFFYNLTFTIVPGEDFELNRAILHGAAIIFV